MNHYEQVREFSEITGSYVNYDPVAHIPEAILLLRQRLIEEELFEYLSAARKGDLENVGKELADLLYVVYGSCVAHGICDIDEIFDEVHRSNMSKLDDDGRAIINRHGKVMKGPNYTPPNLRRFFYND